MQKFAVAVMMVVAVLAGYSTAHAIVIGPTNLDVLGYPDPQCRKPIEPYIRDEMLVSLFKLELERYKRCIKEYLEGAKNDRERILEKYNETVNEYNNFMSSIR